MPLRFRALRWAFVAAALVAALPARAVEAPAGGPVIESIEGDRIVVVITPKGNRVGERGTGIAFGDRIKTGPHATARVRYPDGSRLVIGQATEMEVQESKDGAQYNRLHGGEVRGIIRKVKEPRVLPKFIIRSRAAVMGVRGTDFVMNVEDTAARAEVHTLEGLVEVAGSEPDLIAGRGQLVVENQMVSAKKGVVAPPRGFNRKLYEQMLKVEQPEFVTFAADVQREEERAARENLEVVEGEAAEPVPAKSPRAKPWFALKRFRLAGAYVRQQTGGSLVTGQLGWHPAFNPTDWLAVRGQLSFTPMKGRTQDDRFIARRTGLALELSPGNLAIETGVGHESWGDHGRGKTYAAAQLSWGLDAGTRARLDRFFVGASAYDGAPNRGREPLPNYTFTLAAGAEVKL